MIRVLQTCLNSLIPAKKTDHHHNALRVFPHFSIILWLAVALSLGGTLLLKMVFAKEQDDRPINYHLKVALKTFPGRKVRLEHNTQDTNPLKWTDCALQRDQGKSKGPFQNLLRPRHGLLYSERGS